jgi:hypothetical protein
MLPLISALFYPQGQTSNTETEGRLLADFPISVSASTGLEKNVTEFLIRYLAIAINVSFLCQGR